MIRPTEEEKKRGKLNGWSDAEIEKGYAIINFDGLGLYIVEEIGDMGTFQRYAMEHKVDLCVDTLAALQATLDGIKIIPVDELPKSFKIHGIDRHYFGWVDTPENRKAIEQYCSKKTYTVTVSHIVHTVFKVDACNESDAADIAHARIDNGEGNVYSILVEDEHGVVVGEYY